MTIETLVVGQMATNCYLVNGIIIDPGDDAEYIISHCKTKPVTIVATHGHFDHILAAYALQLAYNIPFIMHEADAFLLQTMQSSAKHFLHITTDPPPKITKYIEGGDTIGDFTVMHTPGHTPGSICLYSKKENVLFSGDTIFAGGAVGRTDHTYSDPLALSQSIQKILSLPPETKILSGHGDSTTIEKELTYY
jgi:hydroxyacylglutathione hydrolase